MWSNGEKADNQSLKDFEGNFLGQAAYAFVNKVPIWVTEENGDTLSESAICIDHWSEQHRHKDFPKYWDFFQGGIKTSVVVPLVYEGIEHPLGMINCEFKNHIDCTAHAKQVFMDLAKSISIMIHMANVREAQVTNSNDAISEIENLVQNRINILEKKRIFVACPNNCKPDVLTILKNIAKAYSPEYEFKFWFDMDEPGDVIEQLMKEISNSAYAIIYFSEIDDEEKGTFRDNPNVVYEAGMFQSQKYDTLSPTKFWIPIREKNSPKLPFDFAKERTILIERDDENEIIDKESTIKDIHKRFKHF